MLYLSKALRVLCPEIFITTVLRDPDPRHVPYCGSSVVVELLTVQSRLSAGGVPGRLVILYLLPFPEPNVRTTPGNHWYFLSSKTFLSWVATM